MDTKALFQSICFLLFFCVMGAFLIGLGRKNNKSAFRSWVIFYGPALILILIGIGASPALYRSVAGENASTLFEREVSNTHEKAYFAVEHPNTEHTLEMWPTSSANEYDEGDASIKIMDARGQTLFDQKVHFTTENDGTSSHEYYNWKHEEEQFTPPNGGQASIEVVSMQGKVSDMHIWIRDPGKTNGKRS